MYFLDRDPHQVSEFLTDGHAEEIRKECFILLSNWYRRFNPEIKHSNYMIDMSPLANLDWSATKVESPWVDWLLLGLGNVRWMVQLMACLDMRLGNPKYRKIEDTIWPWLNSFPFKNHTVPPGGTTTDEVIQAARLAYNVNYPEPKWFPKATPGKLKAPKKRK